MKLCGAMDLHSNNNVTVLSNEKDEVVYRKRLPNDLKLILEQLAPYQSEIEGIVVEWPEGQACVLILLKNPPFILREPQDERRSR